MLSSLCQFFMSDLNIESFAIGVSSTCLLLIAIRTIASYKYISAGRWLAGLVISLLAYCIAPVVYESEFIGPITLFIAATVPPVFWLFCRSLFDDQYSTTSWNGPAAIAFISYLIIAAFRVWLLEQPPSALGSAIFYLSYAYQLAFVCLALFSLIHSGADDLVDARRTLRRLILFWSAAYVTIVLLVELWFGNREIPELLTLSNSMGLGLTFLLFATWYLILAPDDLISTNLAGKSKQQSSVQDLTHAEKQWLTSLETAMQEDKVYRRPEMTIKTLAGEMGIPEHLLRNLINQRLGYRNFRFYLNGFRLDEVAARLRSPEYDRTPVLTLALEAGFASITPFNRAFREKFGVSPTTFRQERGDVTD